ncbi:MAG: lipoprotein-releasing system ATP-binding protein [Chlamydiales bacterium]|jgi:lipoprotein-releasing system ATP-binding protein
MEAQLVELRGVGKSFGGPAGGTAVKVFEGIDMTVARGETVAVVGPSGSGKSSLLNLIGGLDQATSGEVLFEGELLADKNPDQLATLRSEKIGFVFQAHHLLPQCSALENVLVPTLARRGRASADLEQRARTLLDRVGLGPRVDHRPGQLSGGECQRVAFVRAWIYKPVLVVADEPTGALDRDTADELSELLLEWNREEGAALLVVTHSQRLAQRMGRVLTLERGNLTASGA